MPDHGHRLEFSKPCLLIVEGNDDKCFFEALLSYLSSSSRLQSISQSFDIYNLNGKDRLNDVLKTIKQTPGFNSVKALGIVRDSNSHPARTFQSIQNALKSAGFSCPKKEMEMVGEEPKISIKLIPGINQTGMLEDLCLSSVRADPAINCVDSYFDCLKERKIIISKDKPKAKCQAFLASRPRSPRDTGIAAKRSVWPFESSAFGEMRQFLINLFQVNDQG